MLLERNVSVRIVDRRQTCIICGAHEDVSKLKTKEGIRYSQELAQVKSHLRKCSFVSRATQLSRDVDLFPDSHGLVEKTVPVKRSG